jgi:hypothetical protein
MTTTAQAIAATSEQVVNTNNEIVLDEFGRDEAERTVILSPRDAESVDVEVAKGKHDTYDDALAHVIQRGLAEIKRQRDAAEAIREKSKLKSTRDLYASMLKLNPALVADSNFVAKMIADLGVSKKS